MSSDGSFEIIRLSEIDTSFANYWVELIKSSTQSSFFHQLHYLKMLQDVFERDVRLWYQFKGNRFTSGGILFPSKKNTSFIVSPYYLPYNDPLFYEPGKELNVTRTIRISRGMEAFIQFMEKYFSFVELEFSPSTQDVREFLYAPKWDVIPRYTFQINLSFSEKYMDLIHRDERRQIRNFDKSVEIIDSLPEEQFSDLIFQVYHRHQILPPLSRLDLLRWIHGIINLLGVHFVGLENNQKELEAGLLYVTFKKSAYFLLMAARETKGPSYTPYLMYHAVQQIRKKGITLIDLLGGMHKSIAKFKIHMGASPIVHFRVRMIHNFPIKFIYNLSSIWKKMKRNL